MAIILVLKRRSANLESSDSSESDPHEDAEQTATITEAVADLTYNIASSTISTVGSGVGYLTSMVYGNPTEDHKTSDCKS